MYVALYTLGNVLSCTAKHVLHDNRSILLQLRSLSTRNASSIIAVSLAPSASPLLRPRFDDRSVPTHRRPFRLKFRVPVPIPLFPY